MSALFLTPDSLIAFVLLALLLFGSLVLLAIALYDYIATLRRRQEFFSAIGASEHVASPWFWSLAYALTVVCASLALIVIFFLRPTFLFR